MLQRDQFPFTVSDPSNSVTLDGPLRRSYIPLLCMLGWRIERENYFYEGGYGTRRLSDCFVCFFLIPPTALSVVYVPIGFGVVAMMGA